MAVLKDCQGDASFPHPPAGLVYCMDYLEKNIDGLEGKLKPLIEDHYMLFDFPGQVELFLLHSNATSVINKLIKKMDLRLTAVQFIDAHLCCDPGKYVPTLHGHVYSINDNARAEEEATDYEFVIRQLIKVEKVGVLVINDCPKFDLIPLNIGPDGHVASLFPNHPALELKNDWVTYMTNSPALELQTVNYWLKL
ncbi:uncharacterized protein [Miscanthus floridulus]|uniref:uncharacterized protein n=1 Tax=Miscanthus floridulus TaxID=154761 RepID=UPI003458F8F3